jgi:PAS domain S-box-containing protein
VWHADAQGRMHPIDDSWARFLGVADEQIRGHGWMHFMHPSDVESVSRIWTETLRQQRREEATFRLRRHDGLWRDMHVSAVPLFDFAGRFEEWFGVTTDVTEQREAERAIHGRSTRLLLAMNAADVIILNVNLQADEVTIERASDIGDWQNSTRTRVLPYDVFMSSIHADDRARITDSIQQMLDGSRMSVDIDLRVIWGEAEHWMHGRAMIQKNENGVAERIIAGVYDVSDRKRMELDLRNADQRKNEFLAMLAHELRNPLAPLRTAIELASRNDGASRSYDLTAMMERQVTQLSHLVDDLLEVSRITQGRITLKQEPLLIGTIAYSAVESVVGSINARGQSITVDVPSQTIWVCADATRMTQVLVNILNNANKYTQEGGAIEMVVTADDTSVNVEINDNGPGVPPELLPHIFDLFSQGERTLDRSQGGLGIGLALVRRLVNMHNGTIEINDRGSPRGTTVRIRLPRLLHDEHAKVTLRQAPPVAAVQVHLRILIVDDNRDAADSLAILCEDEGYVTAVAYDPRDALDLAQSFDPDVAILDIGLPGMDGYELATRMRSREAITPVLIAVTGYGQIEDRLRAQSVGFNHHFLKPVEVNALLAVLRSSVNAD